MKVDFHVHTSFSSDSRTTLEQLADAASRLGIVPAITDHSTMEGAFEFRKFKIPFIPGEEMRVFFEGKQADLSGLFLTEPIPPRIDALEALELIKEQGGLSYLPHMYDISRYGIGDGEFAEKVDIIEVFNARCIKMFDDKALALAKKLGKPMAAGSDSHFIQEFGETYTEIGGAELEPKAFLKALRKPKIVGKRISLIKRGIRRLFS